METSSSAMGMSRWVKWTVGGVSGLDVGLSLALWFSAGHGDEEEYLREQVLGFGFLHSTFDLLLLSLIRNLAFITIFANLPLVFSWTSSPKPRRRRRRTSEAEDEDEATPSIVDSRSRPPPPSSIRATLTSSALLVRGLTLLLPLSSLVYLIIKLSLAYALLFSSSSSTESGPDEAPRRHGASEVAFNVALLCIAFISSAMELGLILHCFFRMNAQAGEGQESRGRRLRRLKKAAGSGTVTELEAQGLLLDEEDEDEDEDDDDEQDSKEEDEEKKVEIKHASFGRLLVVASPERWLLIWGFVALLFSSATSLAIPAYFGQVLEAVVSPLEDSRAELGRTMLSLTVIFAVGGVAQFAKEWLFTLAGQRLVARLRKDLLQAALRQEVAYFDTTRTGELTSRLSSDTTTLQSTLTENLFEFVSDILRTVGAVVLLFVTSTTLTLIMLGVVPLVGVGTMLYARYLEKLGKEFQDALAKASATAEEMISNIRTVRSFSREKRAHESYSKDIDESFRIGRRTALATGLFMGLVTFVGYSAIALVVYEGAIRVLNGTITSGTLTSFVLYTITLAESAGAMTYLFGEFMSAVGSTERIFELLDRKPAIPTEGGSKDVSMAMAKDPMEDESASSVLLDNDTSILELRSLDRPPREMMEGDAIAAPVLELRNVKFFYPSRPETIILNDVSLSLSRGTVTALVGPSGGGKSTIVSLIERFYDPVEGEVRFHGANIKDLDPVWYRKHLGLVSQEPVLFAGTIRENIMYGVKNASQQRIEEAARLANAHEFVMGFKDQYETVVGERGVRLSGGQKQRIAIARALLMDPEVLLLDEATSALDAESEHLVQEAIDRAMLNRTVLVVAHRLSTVRSASRVVVVGEGRIMESGTHDQLVNIPDGTYRKLVERQLQ